jgi:hypothetical protein
MAGRMKCGEKNRRISVGKKRMRRRSKLNAVVGDNRFFLLKKAGIEDTACGATEVAVEPM